MNPAPFYVVDFATTAPSFGTGYRQDVHGDDVYMNIVLRANADDPVLALEDIQRFADESGFSYQLTVHSHGFSARAVFTFERERDVFDALRSAIEAMERCLKGARVSRLTTSQDSSNS